MDGSKPILMAVLKNILTRIWTHIRNWKIDERAPGIFSFWFESQEKCKFVLEKRPWIINNTLMNIKEWPENGMWSSENFEIAMIWEPWVFHSNT